MTNGDKIIDTLVDNAAGALKRAVRKALNGIFVDKEHSKPYIEDGKDVKEYASSKSEKINFMPYAFDGGWAPMDDWHELVDHQLPGFMKWDDVCKSDGDELEVKTDVYLYAFKFKGSGPRLILLEQFCNELDVTYEEYRKIIEVSPSLIPVLIPHAEFQKVMFNREAEYNEELLEPHYLIPVAGLLITILNMRFSSKDAIDFKRAVIKSLEIISAEKENQ